MYIEHFPTLLHYDVTIKSQLMLLLYCVLLNALFDSSNVMVYPPIVFRLYILLLKMETTIKHAEEERMKALENARHLFEEHQLLKEQINAMRGNIGLDQIPDSLCGGEASSNIVHK
jgi:hypothetical protein